MKNNGYKIAAMAGVKSMQKFWFMRELEELNNELPGTLHHGLEHLDVLGLIHIYKIDLYFLNPFYLLPAYSPNFNNIKEYYKAWDLKRRTKGYDTSVSATDLMEAQLRLNDYVEKSRS